MHTTQPPQGFPSFTILPTVAFDKKALLSQDKMQLSGTMKALLSQKIWVHVLILLFTWCETLDNLCTLAYASESGG